MNRTTNAEEDIDDHHGGVDMGEPIQDDASTNEDEGGFSDNTEQQAPSTHAAGTGIPSADEAAESGVESDDFLQDEPGPPDPPD